MRDSLISLDENQRACLRLVAQGYTSKQIAQRMSLTPGTVDQYVYRATVALGARDRREAARMLAEAEKAGTLNLFELKPDRLVENGDDAEKGASAQSSPILDDPDQAGGSRRYIARVRRLITNILATIGGEPHGLNEWQVLIAIFRVALWAGGTLAALITIGYWLNHLFR
ncbi:helix-turn-helix transcriptional regulator [Sphingobium sp. AP49]|uniref:helix-turn-helix domain-containing protein n=1 Tax=Sphingobium sp. AP49 TaxID=1144307 RepID=UPI00026ECD03|nr:helix-turn-helix transcriptional regulator [Sphingobium sp. AP49]WHO38339.1 helix-turn-helix transcriptional regulator [Sphingobium sp. AP49]